MAAQRKLTPEQDQKARKLYEDRPAEGYVGKSAKDVAAALSAEVGHEISLTTALAAVRRAGGTVRGRGGRPRSEGSARPAPATV